MADGGGDGGRMGDYMGELVVDEACETVVVGVGEGVGGADSVPPRSWLGAPKYSKEQFSNLL